MSFLFVVDNSIMSEFLTDFYFLYFSLQFIFIKYNFISLRWNKSKIIYYLELKKLLLKINKNLNIEFKSLEEQCKKINKSAVDGDQLTIKVLNSFGTIHEKIKDFEYKTFNNCYNEQSENLNYTEKANEPEINHYDIKIPE